MLPGYCCLNAVRLRNPAEVIARFKAACDVTACDEEFDTHMDCHFEGFEEDTYCLGSRGLPDILPEWLEYAPTAGTKWYVGTTENCETRHQQHLGVDPRFAEMGAGWIQHLTGRKKDSNGNEKPADPFGGWRIMERTTAPGRAWS